MCVVREVSDSPAHERRLTNFYGHADNNTLLVCHPCLSFVIYVSFVSLSLVGALLGMSLLSLSLAYGKWEMIR